MKKILQTKLQNIIILYYKLVVQKYKVFLATFIKHSIFIIIEGFLFCCAYVCNLQDLIVRMYELATSAFGVLFLL